MTLSLTVLGMLIAFVAMVALFNALFQWPQTSFGVAHPVTVQQVLGWFNAPLAWLMGVPAKDCMTIGQVLGERIVLNEFVAFADLGKLAAALDPKSFVISTYALCGFANLSSIAIQVGGIGALAPARKSDVARLGLKAVAAGTMANFMSACIAGMLL